jgi:NAD(P)-dependent dehydrogenase (short-subunit alcohol dehydrogenase family)
MTETGRPEAPTAIVTGAGSGIGRATAELLMDKRWHVAFLDIDDKALAAVVADHAGKPGVRFIAADVTDEAAVEKAVVETERALGRIKGVVNSAGIAANTSVFDTSPDLFRRVLDVNVVGTFLVGRAAAARMRETGGGSIVNIASISGIRGSLNRTAYGASKGAVITMTKVMANELAAYGIRVNAVAPGPVETAMVKAHHTAEDRTLYHRFIPMRRYAEPREIAAAAHFLLDETQSSYVTAEILAVDGGYRGAGLVGEAGA